jgi:acyl dehydratase
MTSGYFFVELYIGQTAMLCKTITEQDLLMYSAVCLDANPLHMDDAAGCQSGFGGRIAVGRSDLGVAGHPLAVTGHDLPATIAEIPRPGED